MLLFFPFLQEAQGNISCLSFHPGPAQDLLTPEATMSTAAPPCLMMCQLLLIPLSKVQPAYSLHISSLLPLSGTIQEVEGEGGARKAIRQTEKGTLDQSTTSGNHFVWPGGVALNLPTQQP